jgi:methionine synthase II (cobalamin-independent)
MAFAALLNEEAHELAEIGIDMVQFDEPAFNIYLGEVTEGGSRRWPAPERTKTFSLRIYNLSVPYG